MDAYAQYSILVLSNGACGIFFQTYKIYLYVWIFYFPDEFELVYNSVLICFPFNTVF